MIVPSSVLDVAVKSLITVFGMSNVVDSPTPVCVLEYEPITQVTECVNDDDLRFVATVSGFVAEDSVMGFGDTLGADALGIVGSVNDADTQPVSNPMPPMRVLPEHEPLPVPSSL